MTYILNKFEAGEVICKGFVCGWEFAEGFDGNYEHRPLMQDAMQELESDDVIRVYNEMSHVGHMLTAYGAPFGTTIKSFTAADLKLINDFKTQGGEAAIKLNGKDLQLSA